MRVATVGDEHRRRRDRAPSRTAHARWTLRLCLHGGEHFTARPLDEYEVRAARTHCEIDRMAVHENTSLRRLGALVDGDEERGLRSEKHACSDAADVWRRRNLRSSEGGAEELHERLVIA